VSGVNSEVQKVPEGYKQTEVGVIPTSWSVKKIGAVAEVSSGGTPNRENKDYWNGDIPWVTTTLINGNKITSAEQFITNKGLASSATKWFKAGTILMAMYGQGKTRGKVSILGFDATINQACAAIVVQKSVNSDYFLHYLNSQYEGLRELSNSGGQENLSGAIIKTIKIPFPKAKEQTAIANALSDVDALITSLEKLIAKKRAIKTAAMQQLLTGKKRLPPFGTGKHQSSNATNGQAPANPQNNKTTTPGYKQTELGEIPVDWDVKSLLDLCSLKSGATITGDKIDDSSSYPCYGGNGLRGRTKVFTHDGEYALIGRQGALCGNVQYVYGRFFASEHALVATPTKKASLKWLSIYLERMNLNQYSESSAQPGLSAVKLLVLKLITPAKEEQEAIANTLSVMADEIDALENRLNKTQKIKQGMMQELLTGRTRLI